MSDKELYKILTARWGFPAYRCIDKGKSLGNLGCFVEGMTCLAWGEEFPQMHDSFDHHSTISVTCDLFSVKFFCVVRMGWRYAVVLETRSKVKNLLEI